MKQAQIDSCIRHAEQTCHNSGGRFTGKRKNVLLTLLYADARPLSAYEVAEQYQQHFASSIPVMSVYRMLDFLIEQGLVHRLESSNKYLACEHMACDHRHEFPQFLICDNCQHVDEVGIKKETMQSLDSSVQQSGFKLKSPQLELHGLCRDCSR